MKQQTGIGRNEFIDTMNNCRSKGWLNWRQKKTFSDFFPSAPVSVDVEYWYIVNIGYLTQSEGNFPLSPKSSIFIFFVKKKKVQQCSPSEQQTVDAIIESNSSKLAGELDRSSLISLYKKGFFLLFFSN